MDSALRNFLLVFVPYILLLNTGVDCDISGIITVESFAARGLNIRVEKYPLSRRATFTQKTIVKDFCEPNAFYPADPLEIIENVRAAEDCVVMCRQNKECLASAYFYMSKKCFTSKVVLNPGAETELFREMDAQYCQVFHIQHNPAILHPSPLWRGNPMRCGETHYKLQRSPARRQKRIIGGRDVYQYYSLPFMIRLQDAGDMEVVCGATLFSLDDSPSPAACYALTAAHCVSGFAPNDIVPRPFQATINAYAGSHDVRFTEARTQKRRLIRAYVHPDFRPDDEHEFTNDLAIIMFNECFELNAFVGTTCLPKPSMFPLPFTKSKYSTCYSAGWGHFYEQETNQFDVRINQEYPNSLRLATHKVSEGKKNILMVEPSGEYAGENAHGDSGSPLICLNSENRYYVRGIASERSFYETFFRREWKTRNHFTNVESFYHWIKTIMTTEIRANNGAYVFNY